MARIYKPTYTDPETGERVEQGVWWLDYSVNGKRYRESAKTTEKSEAERKLAERLVARGNAPVQAAAERTTFERLCELIRRDYRRNGNKSTDRMELSLKHLSSFFEGWKAAAINEAAVEDYIEQRLDDGYAPATINRELAALKRMLRLGYKQGLVERQPDISTLSEDNARKGFFSEEALREVLAECAPHIRPIVEVGYITGWRKSELLSRDWRHCDLRDGWLRLEPGESKSGEGRQFPLTDRLRGVLERQREIRDAVQRRTGRIIKPLFFRHDDTWGTAGDRIKSFRTGWNGALRRSGHEDRIFHDFRRTAVRNLVRAGVPEKVAMDLTGHKTREVFDRYNIVSEGMLKQAGEQLDAMQGGG